MFSQRVLVALDDGQSVVYAPASGWNRIYLLWTFRNFRSLPQNVLNPRQQQLIGSLYREAAHYPSHELPGAAVVGAVEDFRPSSLPAPSVKARKQVEGEKKSPDASTLASKPFHMSICLRPEDAESRGSRRGAPDCDIGLVSIGSPTGHIQADSRRGAANKRTHRDRERGHGERRDAESSRPRSSRACIECDPASQYKYQSRNRDSPCGYTRPGCSAERSSAQPSE